MRGFEIRPVSGVKGKISLPADKSIAHRAVILSALAVGKTRIENFPVNKDCLATISIFKRLGIKISRKLNTVEIIGKGLLGLSKPSNTVSILESGTTFRLLLGVLAGQNFTTRLTAGKALSKRPMLRVTSPLRKMGAIINSKSKYLNSKYEEFPPIEITGGNLKSITYKLPVASAQVKSAILLAALYAKGRTKVIEPIPSRDHTERMLKVFKARINVGNNSISLRGNKKLISPGKIYVPGDISSAAFFMVAGSIVPDSQIIIKNVCLNPTRIGVIKVLKRMEADIRVSGDQDIRGSGMEPFGNIEVRSSKLKGVTINESEVPSLIDELPILMVAASISKGRTVIKGVQELRLKETDRIKSMTKNLRIMGADIAVLKSGGVENIIISGVAQLKGGSVSAFGDHRTAMSMIIAGLAANGNTKIDNVSCISKSFPEFIKILNKLISKKS